MPFDATAFLNELNKAGQLAPEQLTVLQGALGKPEVVKFLEENQLRQSDYSRAMNALREKETATTALQSDLVKWKADQEKRIQQMDLTAKQEREMRAKLEAVVKSKADEYGLDANEILSAVGTTPNPAPPTNPNPEPAKKFITAEDLTREFDSIKGTVPYLPAILHDLDVKHQTLFGTRLSDSTSLVRKALEQNKPIEAVWQEEFKVAERQAQIQEEAIQKRINDAVAAATTKLISENHLPVQAPAGVASPILAEFKPPAQNRNEMSGVEAAVANFAERMAGTTSGATGA